jgi:hypothetical protein
MSGRFFRRRAVGASIVLAGCLAAVGATWSLAGTGATLTQPTVIRTMEVGGFGKGIDLGTTGNSVGDEGVIYHQLYDHAGTRRLGSVTVICFTVFPKSSTFECYSTMHLQGGTVGVAGTYYGTHNVNRWAVTGGTGQYQNARGWMYIAPAPNGLLYHDLYLLP